MTSTQNERSTVTLTSDVARAEAGRARRFKARLRAGEVVHGGWLTIPDLSVCDIMARAGFDYLIIDAEHSPWTIADIQLALAVFAPSPTAVLVRIPSHDAVFIKQVLDVGIDGIICPIVRTAEEARLLVSECRYPPAGIRGFGPRRAAAYGVEVADYTAATNDDVIVIPQIEDAGYLAEVVGMIETDGIDAICLGPTDLSGSLGLLRQFDHPDVVEALDFVLDAARTRGVAVCSGIVIGIDDQAEWIAKGARMTLIAADASILADGASSALALIRDRVATG